MVALYLRLAATTTRRLSSISSSSSSSSFQTPHYSCITTIHISNNLKRLFSVKALSWCEPTNSSSVRYNNTGKEEEENKKRRGRIKQSSVSVMNEKVNIIDKFGIVVAMSKNRIIGLNGTIPWKLPQDRLLFKNLTRNQILIIGRHTFEECSNLQHIDHTKFCIVISTSMMMNQNSLEKEEEIIKSENSSSSNNDDISPKKKKKQQQPSIHIVRSFSEALEMAKQIYDDHYNIAAKPTTATTTTDDDDDENENDSYKQDDGNGNSNSIVCWIAGGQKIYEEALKHPNLSEIHLSVVDMTIDYSKNNNNEESESVVAMFPPKYRWDHKFHIPPSRVEYPSTTTTATTLRKSNNDNDDDDDDNDNERQGKKESSITSPGFEYFVYKRK